MSRGSTPNNLLCLASTWTTNEVCKCAPELQVQTVPTNVAAIAAVRSSTGPKWHAVVAALGTDNDSYIMKRDRSCDLLVACQQAGLPFILFSQTASRDPKMKHQFMALGAKAVVSSKTELRTVLDSLDDVEMALEDRLDVFSREEVPRAAAAPRRVPKAKPVVEESWRYAPIHRHVVRLRVAVKPKKGDKTSSRDFWMRQVTRWGEQLTKLPRPLTYEKFAAPAARRTAKVLRFVHVSDTHHHHRRLIMPPGDVLVHTGDVLGNYGKEDLEAHLRHFLQWITVASGSYEFVILIGGNHDTVLDSHNYPEFKSAKATFISGLPKNCRYLQNTGIEVRGLRIWGTPITPSRVEDQGTRYYSDAFETTQSERQRIYDQIPADLDILLTHAPPARGQDTEEGDTTLSARLSVLQGQKSKRAPDRSAAPRFHCFGHAHHSVGLGSDRHTIYINGAQEMLLRADNTSGGLAWVFDVALPGQST